MNPLAISAALAFVAGTTSQELEIKADAWINTARPITKADVKGKTVLLAFLYSSCCSFQAGADTLRDLNSRYAAKGLLVIGVSRLDDGMSLDQIARDYKLSFPIAADSNGWTRNAYLPHQGGFATAAPRYVLFTPDGKLIRLESTGEMKAAIEERLK